MITTLVLLGVYSVLTAGFTVLSCVTIRRSGDE